MRWTPKTGQWWNAAVSKAKAYANRMPMRPEELDSRLAHLRLHKAIAATEVFKCRAVMAAVKINR